MKLLVFASLMLSAALTSTTARAATIAMCNMGGPPNSNVQTLTAGDMKTGAICMVPPSTTLRIDGRTNPPPTGGIGSAAEPAKVDIGMSTFGVNSLLWIVGPESETVAANTVPYQIKVSGVMFLENAALAIQGCMPPNSDITISDNTFTISQPHPSFSTLGAFAILMFENSGNRLCDNAKLKITTNTISMTSVPSNNTGFAIGFTSPLKLNAGASVQVKSNPITYKNTEGGVKGAYGIAFTDAVIPQADGAELIIAGNKIDGSYITPLYLPAVNAAAATFKMDVTDNTLTAKPGYASIGNALTIFVRPASFGKASVFDLSRNILTVNGSDCLLMTQSLQVNGNAVAYYKDNTLLATDGSAAFGFQSSISTTSNGRIYVEYNKITRNDTTAPTLPAFVLGAMDLQQSSMVSISHNTFAAAAAPLSGRQQFIGKNVGSGSATKEAGSALYVCYNTHYNELLLSRSAVELNVADAIMSITNEECDARTTTAAPTPSTTTTPTSTTTPTTTPLIPYTVPRDSRPTIPSTTATPRPTLPTVPSTTTAATTTGSPLDNGAATGMMSTMAFAAASVALFVGLML